MADKDELISQLKSRMQDATPLVDEPTFHLQTDTLIRFLKSRDWNVIDAETFLKETVEYRRRTSPLQAECRWCNQRPGYHSMRQVGHDENKRPVIYANFAQASTHRNVAEDAIDHVTYLIENAKVTMQPGIYSWVFVIDCTGMTMQSCNPKLGYGVTQILAKHYPERLGLVICINHSPVFHGVWQAIKVFLHENTVSKMKLVRSKRKIQHTFQKYFSDELTSWLLEEIRLNMSKPLPDNQVEFWCPPKQENAHDPRGTPCYIKEYVVKQSNKGDLVRVHKPHPNIVEKLGGMQLCVTISADELAEREVAQANAAHTTISDGSGDDADATELDIAEEFRIPESSASLNT